MKTVPKSWSGRKYRVRPKSCTAGQLFRSNIKVIMTSGYVMKLLKSLHDYNHLIGFTEYFFNNYVHYENVVHCNQILFNGPT